MPFEHHPRATAAILQAPELEIDEAQPFPDQVCRHRYRVPRLLAAVEADFQLSLGSVLRGAQEIHIQAGLACGIEQHGDQEDLPVIQRDAKGPTIGADDHIVDGAFPKLPDGFRDTSKILNRGQRHEAG